MTQMSRGNAPDELKVCTVFDGIILAVVRTMQQRTRTTTAPRKEREHRRLFYKVVGWAAGW